MILNPSILSLKIVGARQQSVEVGEFVSGAVATLGNIFSENKKGNPEKNCLNIVLSFASQSSKQLLQHLSDINIKINTH